MSTGSVSSHSHSEFDYSGEEEEEEQPRQTRSRSAASVSASAGRTRTARPVAASTSSVASASSTGSQRERLPGHVEKQLLADIQLGGGIKYFDFSEHQGLARLLDNPERINIYGVRGDPIRRKISHRVQYLKHRTVAQWNKILDNAFKGNPPKAPKVGSLKKASTREPPPPPSTPAKIASRPPPTPPSTSTTTRKKGSRSVPREIETDSTPSIVSPLAKPVAKMAPTKYRTYLYR